MLIDSLASRALFSSHALFFPYSRSFFSLSRTCLADLVPTRSATRSEYPGANFCPGDDECDVAETPLAAVSSFSFTFAAAKAAASSSAIAPSSRASSSAVQGLISLFSFSLAEEEGGRPRPFEAFDDDDGAPRGAFEEKGGGGGEGFPRSNAALFAPRERGAQRERERSRGRRGAFGPSVPPSTSRSSLPTASSSSRLASLKTLRIRRTRSLSARAPSRPSPFNVENNFSWKSAP